VISAVTDKVTATIPVAAEGRVVNTIRVSTNPRQIAAGPRAGTGYVADQGSGIVSVLGP
jgi:DNA-binding beta-propeller fold protein YncE